MFIRQGGGVTIEQLQHTVSLLTKNAEQMGNWSTELDRKGGRNPAGYIVAEGIRRLFRRQRWNITFGQVEGFPSTNFGRDVEQALQAFGIAANWRNPANEAFKKQNAIEARLLRYRLRKLEKGNTNSN
jgi:hypothetical protein